MKKITDELDEALKVMSLPDSDKPAIELARQYAMMIDSFPLEHLEKIGPKLLAALESLGMTPKARASIVKGKDNDSTTNKSPLDELRARRDQRQRNATSLDSPS
jgi:hypothetical protein